MEDIETVKEMKELLRSFASIAGRYGESTNWDAVQKRLEGLGFKAVPAPLMKARQPEPQPFPELSERAVLCRALDKMGWPQINAFHDELKKGQSIHEDAGGYFLRAIKRLFGIVPRDEVISYKSAAQALIDKYAPKDERPNGERREV